MSNQERYPMASSPYVEFARQWLLRHSEGQNLQNIDISYTEIFTEAPEAAEPDDHGRATWHFHIHDGQIDVGRGIHEGSTLTSIGNYEAILPTAKLVTGGDKQVRHKAYQDLYAAGVERYGDPDEFRKISWTRGLHDALAAVTK